MQAEGIFLQPPRDRILPCSESNGRGAPSGARPHWRHRMLLREKGSGSQGLHGSSRILLCEGSPRACSYSKNLTIRTFYLKKPVYLFSDLVYFTQGNCETDVDVF